MESAVHFIHDLPPSICHIRGPECDVTICRLAYVPIVLCMSGSKGGFNDLNLAGLDSQNVWHILERPGNPLT